MTDALADFKHELMMRRVAFRFLEGRTYQEYVEDKKQRKEKPMPRDEWEARHKKDDAGGASKGDDSKEESSKEESKKVEKGLKSTFKALSKAAVAFVKGAPKAVQKFCTDKEFRKTTLSKAGEAVKKAPEKFVMGAWKGIKHEAHEFKSAAKGITSWVSGGEVSEEESKAIKHVAIHAAITVAVTALTGGFGGLAGFGAKVGINFARAVGKKVALNAVTSGLGSATVMGEEVNHLAHGIAHHKNEIVEVAQHATHAVGDAATQAFGHLMENLAQTLHSLPRVAAKDKKDSKDVDPQSLLTAFVTKAVANEIANLKDEDLEAALEDAAAGKDEKDEKDEKDQKD